jgi:hypothetical protein
MDNDDLIKISIGFVVLIIIWLIYRFFSSSECKQDCPKCSNDCSQCSNDCSQCSSSSNNVSCSTTTCSSTKSCAEPLAYHYTSTNNVSLDNPLGVSGDGTTTYSNTLGVQQNGNTIIFPTTSNIPSGPYMLKIIWAGDKGPIKFTAWPKRIVKLDGGCADFLPGWLSNNKINVPVGIPYIDGVELPQSTNMNVDCAITYTNGQDGTITIDTTGASLPKNTAIVEVYIWQLSSKFASES